MPKVSVVVPIYNVEKYIKKCMDSLVNQTLQEIQIIFVNDGSTDESGNIAKEYASKYPNKIIYLEKENGGLSDARNFGMRYAEGEYIAFLDSDDYVENTMYEEMYNKALQENSDYVECDFLWEYPDKTKKDKRNSYNNKKEMLTNVRVVAWNKLIKREILEKNNISFPKGLRYEDIEFTYKLIPYLNKVSYVDKEFVHYVQRNNSIANVQNERTAEVFTIFDNIIKYYQEKGFYEEYKEELEYSYSRILLCSSLKRICKIKDSKTRKKLIKETFEKLYQQFPLWKENKILNNRSIKNMYMKSINKFTYPIYTKMFQLL
ncbi:MAG: glycosyltransferase [Christensenellales bacterium]